MNNSSFGRSGKYRKAAYSRKYILIGCILAAVVVCMIICGMILDKASGRYQATQQAYVQRARELMDEGRYHEAYEYLNCNSDRNFTEANLLASLSLVHDYYENGSLSSAYRTVRTDLKSNYYLLSESERTFCKQIEEEYDKSCKASSPVVKSYATPYIGMWEGYVNKTQLGEAGRVETKHYNVNRVSHVEKIFKFYKDKKIIYVVKCLDGYVTEITDKRSEAGSSGRSSGSSSGFSGNLVPSPDTEYFSDPEDFYDYYYDDFLDYEEAEEYYYSHGGS